MSQNLTVTLSFVTLTGVKVIEVMDEVTLRSRVTVAQKDILHRTQVTCPWIEVEGRRDPKREGGEVEEVIREMGHYMSNHSKIGWTLHYLLSFWWHVWS